MSNRNKGLLMSVFGVFILSPDSLLIRLANLNDLSLIFYRGALPPITIILFLIIYYKANIAKSFLLLGAILLKPPIWIPIEPKFANPHKA